MNAKKPEVSKEKVVSDDEDDFSKKVAPAEDYQVNQAINYLKNSSIHFCISRIFETISNYLYSLIFRFN